MGIRASTISCACAGLVVASGVVVPADEVQAPMSAKTWHFDQPSDYSYISEVISVNEGGNSLAELKKLPSGAFWQAWYKGPSSKHAPEYHTVAVGADRSIVAAGETWDRSGAGNTSELILNKYNQDGQLLARPSLATNQGVQYTKLTGFTETLGAGNKGSVLYQLSPDGTGWYYHDGTRWMQAVTKYQANTAAEVNSHCDTFAQQAGTGSLHVKAFLVGDGSQKVQLHSVSVSYASQ